MQYYCYKLCVRPGSYFWRFRKLFMQYIVDNYSKMENGRIQFLRNNQASLRADSYKNIKNANPLDTGKFLFSFIDCKI